VVTVERLEEWIFEDFELLQLLVHLANLTQVEIFEEISVLQL